MQNFVAFSNIRSLISLIISRTIIPKSLLSLTIDRQYKFIILRLIVKSCRLVSAPNSGGPCGK